MICLPWRGIIWKKPLNLRSNDPRAQLFLGKVISLTARTPQDRSDAEDHFMKAIQYDGVRGAYPDPHLEHALHLIGENGDKGEIKEQKSKPTSRCISVSMPADCPATWPSSTDYLTLVRRHRIGTAAPAKVWSPPETSKRFASTPLAMALP